MIDVRNSDEVSDYFAVLIESCNKHYGGLPDAYAASLISHAGAIIALLNLINDRVDSDNDGMVG